MTQRFGGRYSPDGAGAQDQPTRAAMDEQRAIDKAGTRGKLLYLPPIILVLTGLNDGPTVLVAALLGAGALRNNFV